MYAAAVEVWVSGEQHIIRRCRDSKSSFSTRNLHFHKLALLLCVVSGALESGVSLRPVFLSCQGGSALQILFFFFNETKASSFHASGCYLKALKHTHLTPWVTVSLATLRRYVAVCAVNKLLGHQIGSVHLMLFETHIAFWDHLRNNLDDIVIPRNKNTYLERNMAFTSSPEPLWRRVTFHLCLSVSPRQ